MWLHENKEVTSIEEMPEGTFGYVYQVTHIPTGLKYIGKKQLISNRTLPPLKGEKRKRKIQKESDVLKKKNRKRLENVLRKSSGDKNSCKGE